MRDFRGHGPTPPDPRWPGGARVAVSFVVNVEEGAELSMIDGDERNAVFQILPQRLASLGTRMGKSLPVGNEGAGIVVAAGEHHKELIGKPVSVMGGAMVTRHRVVPAENVLAIPDGVPIEKGAAALINPLTALAMIETLRDQGHHALVHTAAASSLGQMLNRICL